jgi:protein tyrosine phosphatase (PTP) superfamily phosphohydrolase (DUF442 family)
MVVAGAAACVGMIAACSSTKHSASDRPGPAPTAQCDLNAAPTAATKPPAALADGTTVAVPVPHDEQAIHNVYLLEGSDGKLISGGVPEGDAGFDELKRMGVRTIISVDGATPELSKAEARGMRYVHIPVTYADVTEEQRSEIARAVRDLPGPVYIHCHHGKHRSPAAAASAAVALGYITPEQGVAFLKTAGTAPNYQGLYRCVADARVATPAQLAAASAEFPAVQRPQGMVAAMVEVDVAFENLGEIRAAGWVVPSDHPDLVPAAEAGRLADNIRFSGEDHKTLVWGEAYQAKLKHAIEVAGQLEEDLVRGAPREQLEAGYKLVQASCKDCHAAYRDKKDD